MRSWIFTLMLHSIIALSMAACGSKELDSGGPHGGDSESDTDTDTDTDTDSTIPEGEAKAVYWEALCPRNLECYSQDALDAYGWATTEDCLATWKDDIDFDGDGRTGEECDQAELNECLAAIAKSDCKGIQYGSGFVLTCAQVSCE